MLLCGRQADSHILHEGEWLTFQGLKLVQELPRWGSILELLRRVSPNINIDRDTNIQITEHRVLD